jgi:hypothetical protein
MTRAVFVLLGLVIALVPGRVRETYEQLAFKNPDEVSAKPSFTLAIRAEGLIFVLIGLLGERAYRASMHVLGLAGAIALVVPKQALQVSINVSYERPETIEWKDGLIPLIRAFGVLYLLIACNEVKSRNREK